MAERLEFLNANGLIKGSIPAGNVCPFFEECIMLNDRCPQPGKVHDGAYSCAAARAFSMTKIE